MRSDKVIALVLALMLAGFSAVAFAEEKPKNKKTTCVKAPTSKGGAGGHHVSHETGLKVNTNDYEKQYKQSLKEAKKKNKETIKAAEEQQRQKEAERLAQEERRKNAKPVSKRKKQLAENE